MDAPRAPDSLGTWHVARMGAERRAGRRSLYPAVTRRTASDLIPTRAAITRRSRARSYACFPARSRMELLAATVAALLPGTPLAERDARPRHYSRERLLSIAAPSRGAATDSRRSRE